MKLQRIDPPDCGCTDCLVGYSAPLDAPIDPVVAEALIDGRLINASGREIVRRVEVTYETKETT